MKALLLSLLLALAATSFTGCATIGTGTGPGAVDPAERAARGAALAKATVRSLTLYAAQKDTNAVQYLNTALAAIDTFLLTPATDYSPDALYQALAKLDAPELRSAEAQIAINTVLGLYEIYYADRLRASIDQNLYLRLFIVAVRDGLQTGLQDVARLQPPK